jgi:beta-lactamase class A
VNAGRRDLMQRASRERLGAWMRSSRTGLERLRAGVPRDWIAGDKSGTGSGGAVNDVALFSPPGGDPILVTCYLSGSRR